MEIEQKTSKTVAMRSMARQQCQPDGRRPDPHNSNKFEVTWHPNDVMDHCAMISTLYDDGIHVPVVHVADAY